MFYAMVWRNYSCEDIFIYGFQNKLAMKPQADYACYKVGCLLEIFLVLMECVVWAKNEA